MFCRVPVFSSGGSNPLRYNFRSTEGVPIKLKLNTTSSLFICNKCINALSDLSFIIIINTLHIICEIYSSPVETNITSPFIPAICTFDRSTRNNHFLSNITRLSQITHHRTLSNRRCRPELPVSPGECSRSSWTHVFVRPMRRVRHPVFIIEING